MPFLIYITLLAVSVSTILLELHWLTSPPLQPKPAIHAARTSPPAAREKAEGPNAELTPVYPRKSDVPRSVGSVTGAPQPGEPADQAAASVPAVTETTAKVEPARQAAETTGAAPAPEGTTPSTVSSATVASNTTDTPRTTPVTNAPVARSASVATKSQCDVQSCSAAYKSFQVSDCTYQPFQGPRRLCEKPPEAGRSVAREHNAEPAARRANKDVELREVVRRVKQLTDDDAADPDDFEMLNKPSRVIVIRRPDPRW
jgi:hypothetical protein